MAMNPSAPLFVPTYTSGETGAPDNSIRPAPSSLQHASPKHNVVLSARAMPLSSESAPQRQTQEVPGPRPRRGGSPGVSDGPRGGNPPWLHYIDGNHTECLFISNLFASAANSNYSPTHASDGLHQESFADPGPPRVQDPELVYREIGRLRESIRGPLEQVAVYARGQVPSSNFRHFTELGDLDFTNHGIRYGTEGQGESLRRRGYFVPPGFDPSRIPRNNGPVPGQVNGTGMDFILPVVQLGFLIPEMRRSAMDHAHLTDCTAQHCITCELGFQYFTMMARAGSDNAYMPYRQERLKLPRHERCPCGRLSKSCVCGPCPVSAAEIVRAVVAGGSLDRWRLEPSQGKKCSEKERDPYWALAESCTRVVAFLQYLLSALIQECGEDKLYVLRQDLSVRSECLVDGCRRANRGCSAVARADYVLYLRTPSHHHYVGDKNVPARHFCAMFAAALRNDSTGTGQCPSCRTATPRRVTKETTRIPDLLMVAVSELTAGEKLPKDDVRRRGQTGHNLNRCQPAIRFGIIKTGNSAMVLPLEGVRPGRMANQQLWETATKKPGATFYDFNLVAIICLVSSQPDWSGAPNPKGARCTDPCRDNGSFIPEEGHLILLVRQTRPDPTPFNGGMRGDHWTAFNAFQVVSGIRTFEWYDRIKPIQEGKAVLQPIICVYRNAHGNSQEIRAVGLAKRLGESLKDAEQRNRNDNDRGIRILQRPSELVDRSDTDIDIALPEAQLTELSNYTDMNFRRLFNDKRERLCSSNGSNAKFRGSAEGCTPEPRRVLKGLTQEEVGDMERGNEPYIVAMDAEFVKCLVDATPGFINGSRIDEENRTQYGPSVDGKVPLISLARLSIMRFEAAARFNDEEIPEVLQDNYVCHDDLVPWDCLTEFSGILTADLLTHLTNKDLITRKALYLQVRYLIDKGAVFIGHGLNNDFRLINVAIPSSQVIDTVNLYHLEGKRYLSLRLLSWMFFGTRIQSKKQIGHDSIEDTIASVKLYCLYKAMVAHDIDIPRLLNHTYSIGALCLWQPTTILSNGGPQAIEHVESEWPSFDPESSLEVQAALPQIITPPAAVRSGAIKFPSTTAARPPDMKSTEEWPEID